MRRSVSALALVSSVTAATSTNPSGGDMRIVTSSLTHVTSLEPRRGEDALKRGCHCRANGARQSDRVGLRDLDWILLREDPPSRLFSVKEIKLNHRPEVETLI